MNLFMKVYIVRRNGTIWIIYAVFRNMYPTATHTDLICCIVFTVKLAVNPKFREAIL